MSRELFSRNPDLKRLLDEGYFVQQRGGHLVMREVPYVDEHRAVRIGTLISSMTLAGDQTQRPDTHVVHWDGEFPCQEHLEPGILYVSTEYATSAHSCCCGCGEEVVAPFTPTDWRMTFDGETISLDPSIGNWTLNCRSHYVVERGEVLEAGPWSEEQVEAVRRRQRAAKTRFYARLPAPTPVVPARLKPPPGRLLRLCRWFISWKYGAQDGDREPAGCSRRRPESSAGYTDLS